MLKLTILVICRSILFTVFFGLSSTLSVYGATPAINPGKIFLVSETQSISKNTKVLWLGIHHKLKKGWHTYWRYAGDSGLPIKIRWTEKLNASIGKIKWPIPTVFRTGSLVSYGYKNEVLLLIPVTIKRFAPVNLAATIDWLVCREICIPQRSNLEIQIPLGDGKKNTILMKAFERARSSIPFNLSFKASAYLNHNQIILKLKIPKNILKSVRSITFLPSSDGLIENSKPQIWNKYFFGTDNHLKLQMTAGYALNDGVKILDGTLILENEVEKKYERKAFDISNIPLLSKEHKK